MTQELSEGLFGLVPKIHTPWALAAMAIAALILVVQLLRNRAGPLTGGVVFAIFAIAATPLVFQGIATLREADPVCRFQVVAVNAAGMPIEDATIQSDARSASYAKADGAVEVSVPRTALARQFTVYAEAGALRGAQPVVAKCGDASPIHIPLLAPDLTGRVTDAVTGQGLAHVEVSANGVETSTDSAGHFALKGASPEGVGVEVMFSRPGYTPKRNYYSPGEAVDVALEHR